MQSYTDDLATFNWTGTDVIAHDLPVVRPICIDTLKKALSVGPTSTPLRWFGSRFSRASLLQSRINGTLIDLCGLSGLLALNQESATFFAGTKLEEVYAILLAHARQLPCSPGVIDKQTLGGAIATGTHGQGLSQSSLADVVESFDVLDLQGELHTIGRSHPHFGAYMLSLGLLGVVTSVTLQTVPFSVFTCRKSVVGFDAMCDEYVRWNENDEMVKTWWFTNDDRAHTWHVSRASSANAARYLAGMSADQTGTLTYPPLFEHNAYDSTLNDTIDRISDKMAHEINDRLRQRDALKTVTRFMNYCDVTGNIYQILCKGIPAPQRNFELAVPLSNIRAVLCTIRDAIRHHGLTLHYPLILRSTGTSRAWLSPAHAGPVTYIGFLVYAQESGNYHARADADIAALEKLLAQHGARPHWGKYFTANVYAWDRLYPKMADFRTLRDALDPHRRLANTFLDAII